MRAGRVLGALVALLGVFGVAAALASGGVSWGTAVEVPGTAALNTGGNAEVLSVSCAGAGNCAAGGSYSVGSLDSGQAFLVSEKNGIWGTAIKVPGMAVLNTGGNAEVLSVSCSGAGSCAAGGFYWDSSDLGQAFVVSEKNGVWGAAIEVPDLAALDTDGGALVYSVSCASAGNCAAGGQYQDSSNNTHAFVVNEKNGVWGTAVKLAGTAAVGGWVNSVSCASAGNCAAGGTGFVADEKNGVWGTAKAAVGDVFSVSCASAGNCAAGGLYERGSREQAFVVSEKSGVWGTAVKFLGMALVSTPGPPGVLSVSCASAGDCAAGGFYVDGSRHIQAFVVSEKNGVWGQAIKVPGTVNTGGQAEVLSVSCASTGNCAAGGKYYASNHEQAFVVGEKYGVWGTAIKVPGTAALNTGGEAFTDSVSCASTGKCVAGGRYSTAYRSQAFVTAP